MPQNKLKQTKPEKNDEKKERWDERMKEHYKDASINLIQFLT